MGGEKKGPVLPKESFRKSKHCSVCFRPRSDPWNHRRNGKESDCHRDDFAGGKKVVYI